MNKVINGRRYDTQTAKKIGTYTHGADFDTHYSETLYRKTTGEFFLYGEGGANSRYCNRAGANNCTPGAQIIPLCYGDAEEWAVKHLKPEQYKEDFEAPEKGGEKKTVSFSLTAGAVAKITRIASEKGMAKSEVIEWLLTLV